jgi:hypothetical protein
VNGPVQEVRRLRQQLGAKARELAELRELVNQHLELEAEAEQRCLNRERQAHERGLEEGRETGWRQGVEHALIKVDEAHLTGRAHDQQGQMRELSLHNGPVPPEATPQERVALAEHHARLQADWRVREWERTHQAEADRELEVG